jgi:hypothetical protein
MKARSGRSGDSTSQESANFGRNFRIKERHSLNIRVEFTNIFNRLLIPAGSINLGNFATAPTKSTMGINTGPCSDGYGTVTGLVTGGITSQRAGTVITRFMF